MKNLFLCTAVLLMAFSSSPIMAASKPNPVSEISPAESAKTNAMVMRLNEIKTMDKSTLSRAEKKELRDEVRSTKATLHSQGHGGFYISGGAIIIILLLIILL